MVVKCEIKFDNNPHGVYFAGQVIEVPSNVPKFLTLHEFHIAIRHFRA